MGGKSGSAVSEKGSLEGRIDFIPYIASANISESVAEYTGDLSRPASIREYLNQNFDSHTASLNRYRDFAKSRDYVKKTKPPAYFMEKINERLKRGEYDHRCPVCGTLTSKLRQYMLN